MLESLPRRYRWVFPAAPSGKHPKGDRQFCEKHLLVSLKRVLKKLGRQGHAHTFRHAFISRALMQGIAEAIVRQWVGHVDAEVIKVHTHIADVASQAAMQRLTGAENKGLRSEGNRKGSKSHDGHSAQLGRPSQW